MQIHELNTKALTDPAWVPFDDGSDTYKADFNQIIDDAVAEAFTSADVSGGVVEYESEDAEPLSGASWIDFDLLEGGEDLATLFTLVSEMAYNLRWLRQQNTFLYSRLHLHTYVITPVANSNVSPFSAYAEYSIENDRTTYGYPIGVYVSSGGNANPVSVKLNSTREKIWLYAKNADTDLVVNVLYMKQ